MLLTNKSHAVYTPREHRKKPDSRESKVLNNSSKIDNMLMP